MKSLICKSLEWCYRRGTGIREDLNVKHVIDGTRAGYGWTDINVTVVCLIGLLLEWRMASFR